MGPTYNEWHSPFLTFNEAKFLDEEKLIALTLIVYRFLFAKLCLVIRLTYFFTILYVIMVFLSWKILDRKYF